MKIYDRSTIEKAIKLSNNGNSQNTISKLLNIPRSTIKDWLSGKIPSYIDNRALYKYDEQIKELYHDNLGGRKIASILGDINPGYVNKRLKSMGLSRMKTCIQDKGKLEIKFEFNHSTFCQAAEYELMKICCLYGFEFSVPPPMYPYDLLVNFGEGYKKIQVKSSASKISAEGRIFFIARNRINKKNHRYGKNEVDYFFLHDIDGNSWLIPYEKLKNHTSVKPMNVFPGYQISGEKPKLDP